MTAASPNGFQGCGKLERLDISCCMLSDISCVVQLKDLRELRHRRAYKE